MANKFLSLIGGIGVLLLLVLSVFYMWFTILVTGNEEVTRVIINTGRSGLILEFPEEQDIKTTEAIPRDRWSKPFTVTNNGTKTRVNSCTVVNQNNTCDMNTTPQTFHRKCAAHSTPSWGGIQRSSQTIFY